MKEQRRLYTLWHITSTATEVKRKSDATGAPGHTARLCGEDAFRELEIKKPTPPTWGGLSALELQKKKTSLEASRVHDGILTLILIVLLCGNHGYFLGLLIFQAGV